MTAPTTAEVRERIGARVAMMRAADIKDGGGTAHQAYAWALTETALPIAEHRDALAAEAASLRQVLEDCHAHDLYVREGQDAVEVYRKHHSGVTGDESAGDHYASVRAAVEGRLGGKMLDERDALAAEVARLRAILECGASPYGVHRCVHCDSEVT